MPGEFGLPDNPLTPVDSDGIAGATEWRIPREERRTTGYLLMLSAGFGWCAFSTAGLVLAALHGNWAEVGSSSAETFLSWAAWLAALLGIRFWRLWLWQRLLAGMSGPSGTDDGHPREDPANR